MAVERCRSTLCRLRRKKKKRSILQNKRGRRFRQPRVGKSLFHEFHVVVGGVGHLHGVEDLGQLGLVHDTLVQDQAADRNVLLQRFLSQIGGLLVADVRAERSDRTYAVFQQLGAVLAVGSDALNAVVHEGTSSKSCLNSVRYFGEK